MNEFSNGNGFSAASIEELDQVEGGILPLIFGVVLGVVCLATAINVTVFTVGGPGGDLFGKHHL